MGTGEDRDQDKTLVTRGEVRDWVGHLGDPREPEDCLGCLAPMGDMAAMSMAAGRRCRSLVVELTPGEKPGGRRRSVSDARRWAAGEARACLVVERAMLPRTWWGDCGVRFG